MFFLLLRFPYDGIKYETLLFISSKLPILEQSQFIRMLSMHPNFLMNLSSELQVMCHLSKVQLRNFWTWIQMILRIFCGNKGSVLSFSYSICCFCRFQSALDFLRTSAFTATCLASACDFFSAVRQLLTSNPLSLRLWTELVTSLLRTCSAFLTDLDMYVESTWKSITNLKTPREKV